MEAYGIISQVYVGKTSLFGLDLSAIIVSKIILLQFDWLFFIVGIQLQAVR